MATRSNSPRSPQTRPAPFDWGLAMGLGVPHFSACRFTGDPQCLYRVRRFTRRTLKLWGRRSCAEDTTTVASELVTNALRHALKDRPDGDGWLGLMNRPDAIICAVHDPSLDRPISHPATLHDTKGRGLLIIDVLSQDWGYALHGDSGKTVWALLPT